MRQMDGKMSHRMQAVIKRAQALGLSGYNAYSHRPMVWLGGKARSVAECEAWLDGHEAGWGAAFEIAGAPPDGPAGGGPKSPTGGRAMKIRFTLHNPGGLLGQIGEDRTITSDLDNVGPMLREALQNEIINAGDTIKIWLVDE